MTDLDLLIIGAMVTFLAVAGAYVAIRHRANETPVASFKPGAHSFKGRGDGYGQRNEIQRPHAPPADAHVD